MCLPGCVASEPGACGLCTGCGRWPPVPWGTSRVLLLCPAAVRSGTSWLCGPGEVALPPCALVVVHSWGRCQCSPHSGCRDFICARSQNRACCMAGTQEVGAASLICPSCPLCLSSSPRFLRRAPHPLSLLPSAPPPAYAPVLGTCPRPPVCLAVCGLMGDTDEPASSPLGAPHPVRERRVAAVSSEWL